MAIKNYGVGNFFGGLLDGFVKTAISERDKQREQEKLMRDETRQEALLTLQRLQNKQRVNEFNKSFEFQKNQADIENTRNADKQKFDKLIAYKEYVKQYLPMSSLPQNTDGFVFNQNIPGSIDDDFAKATGVDLLKNDTQYYDTNAYKEAYDNWIQKRNSDAYRLSVGSNSSKQGRIAVVHKPTGQIRLLKEDDYYKKLDQGYFPLETWTPMSLEQASTLGMSQMGYDKSGKRLLDPTSTPGQVADVFKEASGNSNSAWFNNQFTNTTGETQSLTDILNRLKPEGLKTKSDYTTSLDPLGLTGGNYGEAQVIGDNMKDIEAFNNNLWTKQKASNTAGILGFLQNSMQPMQNALENSLTWKDNPSGREQRKAMEMQVASLEEPLRIAYEGINRGLINPEVKNELYNALQLARKYAKANAIQLQLLRQNMTNTAQIKQDIKNSITDK